MGMGRVNPEMFQKPLALTVPAIGGLDQLTPKTEVNPGTLQDCMNYEVSRESGYQLSSGIMKFGGKSLLAYNIYLVADIDSNTNSPTFYAGGIYTAINPSTSEEFQLKVLLEEADKMRLQVIGGSAAKVLDTTLRLYPDAQDATTYRTISGASPETYSSVSDFITKYETVNQNLSAASFQPPGTGPINVLFELNDKIYAARDLANGTGSQLYTTTDLTELSQSVSWETVDMGYSLGYKEGRTKPFTLSDAQFQQEGVPSSVDVINRTGSSVVSVPYTGQDDLSGETVTVQENQIAWQTITNVLDDAGGSNNNTASRGFVALGSQSVPNVFLCTQALRITNFNIGEGQPPTSEIAGIKVDVRYEHLHTEQFPEYDAQKKAVMLSARLLNVGASDNNANQTVYDADGTGFDLKTDSLGGVNDDWNATDLIRENVFAPEFGVELVFAHAKGSDLENFYYGAFTKVYWVRMSVYFDDGTEQVFFWDGAQDVANAQVAEISLNEGSFASDNAAGFLTLYNTSAGIDNVTADLEIRTGANGTGILLSKTSDAPSKNLLPTSAEMEETASISKTIKANFYIDPEREAIYGVTGAGPAFTFNGSYFSFIRPSIPEDQNKPRHIAEHEDHLVLAYNSGSILVSVVGDPTNFSGLEGAVEFGFGDNITDLLPLVGSALGVMCKQSSHAFVGNVLENFTTQIISKTSGAIEYTSAVVGQPIYADFRGIGSIQSTQQYGDFLAGRISQAINDLIQGRLQDVCGVCSGRLRPVGAIAIRNRNQYRLFFNDGLIITLTFFGQGDMSPIFTVQNYGWDASTPNTINPDYAPSVLLSTVLNNGTELNMMGTKDGDIWILDQGTGILDGNGITEYDAFMTFNPFNGGEAHSNLKYNEILIHGKSSGKQELICSSGVNYLAPEPNTTQDSITMGHDGYGFNLGLVPQRRSTHLPNVTAGFSLRIDSVANGNLPHNIQALTFRPTPLGDQNVGQKRAGPSAQM